MLNILQAGPDIVPANKFTIELVRGLTSVVCHPSFEKPVTVSKLLEKAETNPKINKVKSALVRSLSLAPAKSAGLLNMCEYAKTCILPCLFHQGRGKLPGTVAARVARTALYQLRPDIFFPLLYRNLESLQAAADKAGMQGGARLNLFSDVDWLQVVSRFPRLMFWDYTKDRARMDRVGVDGWMAPNYHYTFSYDGTQESERAARRYLENGQTVAVTFYNEDGKCNAHAAKQILPRSYALDGKRFQVIDGDPTDWRIGDPSGVIVGLRLKAATRASRERAIRTGFAQLHTPKHGPFTAAGRAVEYA